MLLDESSAVTVIGIAAPAATSSSGTATENRDAGAASTCTLALAEPACGAVAMIDCGPTDTSVRPGSNVCVPPSAAVKV